MTVEILLLSAILAVAVLLFALEVFPVDKVSVLVLSSLVVFDLVSPEQAIAGFGNPATVTVACMLALSYGIQNTGALNYLSNTLVHLAQKSQFRLLFSIVVAVGVLVGPSSTTRQQWPSFSPSPSPLLVNNVWIPANF